jgi:hypothetical protein
MSLVVGVRWSFRGKDAGSVRSERATGATEDAVLGASSAARRHSRHFAIRSWFSTGAESPFKGKALRQGQCMIQMPAPLTYIPRRLAKPVLVVRLLSKPRRASSRLGPKTTVGTIVRHGEVAEWLKAAPC